jgi:hypothetical protein
MGMNHDMRLFSLLLIGSFRLLNAELNSKPLTKCTYLYLKQGNLKLKKV